MRSTTLFNTGWRFYKGDVPAASLASFDDQNCDDQNWRAVRLPHDWSIEGPFDSQWASATGYLPGGCGWYRKTFDLPEAYDGKKIFVQFDGVYCRSEIWINGHSLGTHPSGFVGFQRELTPFLLPGSTNTLAVRVDHTQFADCRWYTGSGINRNVHLVAVGPVHLQPWGIFATTPIVTSARAEVRVEAEVLNSSAVAVEAVIEHSLRGPEGSIAARCETMATLLPGAVQGVTSTLKVLSPGLWSPENPQLYSLQTRVLVGGEVVDMQETILGIRCIRFDADHGFFLNEQPLKMKGVCLHDDAGALGTAVPPQVWERRLKTLKEGGVNAIRMSHNPHLPELYDLCDRLGFLVQDEAFDEWEGGKNKWVAGWNVGTPSLDGYHDHFAAQAEPDLRAMIRQNRNHPSIVMWSIGNEIDYPNDPYTHEKFDEGTNPQVYGLSFQPEKPHASRLGEIARQLVAVAKTCDTSRPITAGLAAILIANEVGLADALDAVGYNYQEPHYPADHAAYPDRIIYGSENGMRLEFWQAVLDNEYICGQFLWTGIDYLGEAHQWPIRSNSAGLLDLAGFPKSEFYYRQSLWSDVPMVYLGTRDVPLGEEAVTFWTHKKAEPVWAGVVGTPVRVQCFTNCEEAELTLNGRSQGVRRLADAPERILVWDVPYEAGILTVAGRNQGQVAAQNSLRTSGPARKLVAETDRVVLRADGLDLAHIAVSVVDENGVPVYDAAHEVTWTLHGPARLLGLESGDHSSHEDYQANHRKAFGGRLLGYVQSVETAGAVTIQLTAPGLDEATVVLEIQ